MSIASNRRSADHVVASRGLDQLAADLEALRIAHDAVSYSDLTTRIAQQRAKAGFTPAAARIARSTVYDAFRAGRSRISPGLVAEIVLALTGDEVEAEFWRARAIHDMVLTRESRLAARPQPVVMMLRATERPTVVFSILLVIACFGVNNLGGQFVAIFGVPLYLDMVGTAIAAIALGPWYGVAAGLANNVLGSILETNLPSLWFALVNVVGALIWGYGVRAWKLGRSPLRFLLLNLTVALACSLAAVPILVLVFGGSTGHTGQDAILPVLAALGAGLWGAVFSSNLLLSTVDKLLSGYFALLVVWLLAKYGGLRPAFGQHWLIPRAMIQAFPVAWESRSRDYLR